MNTLDYQGIAARLLEATADSYSESFLRQLVEALGRVLKVRYAAVARTDALRQEAETVALWLNGALVPNLRYALAHTPCANVLTQGMCYYPQHIQQLFPEDHELVELGAECYLGVALHRPDGSALGLLTVIDSKPFADDEQVRATLNLFAGRVQAELLRQEAEQERNETLERLREAAYRDSLTRLLSRQGLLDVLARAVTEPSTTGQVLVLLDVARFAEVNNTLGPDAGNQMLQTLGERLRSLPWPAQAARLYGDVFAVFGPEAIAGIAAVERALGETVEVAGYEIPLGMQMGLYRLGPDCHEPGRALTRATIALARAKTRPDLRRVEFEPEMEERLRRRQSMLHELRQALDQERLEVWYQPQIDFATGAVIGMEALARWPGGYSPAEFIPLAEEVGLVPRIGRFVLRSACRDFVALKARWPTLEAVSVNVSPDELMREGFVAETLEILGQAGLEPQRVELELTESLMLEDIHQAGALLAELSRAGLRLALDDFGTGYSSLSYLSSLPLDRLKIDRRFVAELDQPAGGAIVDMILSLARTLRLTVVAEGVETEAQAHVLKAQGCQVAQGYFYAKPMARAELEAWLAARR